MPKIYTPPPSSPLTKFTIPKPQVESPINKKINAPCPSKFLPERPVSDRRITSNKAYQNLKKIYDQQNLLDLAEAAVKEEALKEIELERTLSSLDSMTNILQELEQDLSKLEALELALQSLGDDSFEQTISGQESATDNINTTDN